MEIEKLREKANKLPLKPGVYIMKDRSGGVIYVGKAVKLKNRVSSYFHGSHNAKTEAMVSKVADFDVVVANSEFEALVLENSLIKYHAPKYNILLKDDKGYPFVRLDKKAMYPRFTIVSRQAKDGAAYYGPFGGRNTTRAAIDSVCKAVKLPTCSRKFPRDIGKERPCLNHHLGTCLAYCLKDTPYSSYKAALDAAVMIFEGKTDKLVAGLRADMEAAAEKLQFELAAEYRDRIKAVTTLAEKQHVLSKSRPDMDAVGYYCGEVRSCFVVLHYVNGQLLEKDFELMETPVEDPAEAVSGILRQYYSGDRLPPKTVLLMSELQDMAALEQFLGERVDYKVSLHVPVRGEKRRLVETAQINAREEVVRATTAEERVSKTAEWLQKALGLQTVPKRIEAFDISNTGSSDIVASMTVFSNGKPLKKDYRRFKIASTEIQNDYASMEEVVGRRFRSWREGDEKFSQLPDLLLIDGGANHAAAAQRAMQAEGGNVPVFGMVKDDRHRTRALVTPEGEEIGIVGMPAVFAWIGRIQEETHRFAIEYHRKLRSKRVNASVLDKIEGVGETRKKALLKQFKSIANIKAASVEDLSKVVPKNTAQSIYSYFHQ